MANTYKKLYQGQPGVSAATIYTAPAGTQVIIKSVRALVPSNAANGSTIGLFHGGLTDANRLWPDYPLAPGEMAKEEDLVELQPGETLAAVASVASRVTVTVFGIEMTP
jgi:hypothetical protein